MNPLTYIITKVQWDGGYRWDVYLDAGETLFSHGFADTYNEAVRRAEAECNRIDWK